MASLAGTAKPCVASPGGNDGGKGKVKKGKGKFQVKKGKVKKVKKGKKGKVKKGKGGLEAEGMEGHAHRRVVLVPCRLPAALPA